MRKNIKKVLSGVILGVVCTVGLIFSACVAHNYTMNGYVSSKTNESIVFTDTTGHMWEYLYDTGLREDTFDLHEQVIIHFNDNCSDSNRIDDIITGVEKR